MKLSPVRPLSNPSDLESKAPNVISTVLRAERRLGREVQRILRSLEFGKLRFGKQGEVREIQIP